MVENSIMYKGTRYQLFNSKGNIIEEYDTRILKEEIKLKVKELDEQFTEEYHIKLGFSSKEKGNRKINEARQGILKDKDEQKKLLELDEQIKAEYELRKQLILNAKTCDEVHDAVHKPKKLVKVSKYLGLSSEYKLEDIE